jgi:hypothetical protein
MNEIHQVYIYIRKFCQMKKRERERESGKKIQCTIEKVRCLPVPRMRQREKA